MVDLLVLTSIYQLLFILKIVLTFLTKQATLTRRSIVLSFPLKLVFPGIGISCLVSVRVLVHKAIGDGLIADAPQT